MGPIFPRKALRPTVKRLVINVTEEFVRFSVRNEDPADPLRSTIVTQIPDGFVELWFDDRAQPAGIARLLNTGALGLELKACCNAA